MTLTKRSVLLSVPVALLALLVAWWYFSVNVSSSRTEQQTALDHGIELFRQDQFDAALSSLRSVPTTHPQGWRARYYEGAALLKLKQYRTALEPLEEALYRNVGNTRIMHALGVAHFKLGNLALSKAYFAQVLEIDPNDEEAKGLMDIMTRLEQNSAEQQTTSDAQVDGS